MIYNIEISDFNTLFNKEIFINIIDTLKIYNLIIDNSIQLRKKECKSFIAHFIIFTCVKLLKTSTNNKKIIVVTPNVLDNVELCNYCDIKSFKIITLKILKDLQKLYPTNIIFLKKECDLNNPDVVAYIFNKSNKYENSSVHQIKNTIIENNLKTNNLNLTV